MPHSRTFREVIKLKNKGLSQALISCDCCPYETRQQKGRIEERYMRTWWDGGSLMSLRAEYSVLFVNACLYLLNTPLPPSSITGCQVLSTRDFRHPDSDDSRCHLFLVGTLWTTKLKINFEHTAFLIHKRVEVTGQPSPKNLLMGACGEAWTGAFLEAGVASRMKAK